MRSFIEELKHRNVIRVGIAYVIVGWLFAQVADLAADAFHAPDWFMQMLIVVLLLGLPVVLFLAWAFELTPEGVKKAHEVPVDAPKDLRSGRTLNRVTLLALIAAVGWIAWDATQNGADPDTAQATAVTDKSIAVLPFADFSPGSDQGWFADGLTDEILNALARTRDLRVASRTSSFAYKGSTARAPEIAAELHVAHVLEGSVRRAGNRIRVTAQLIRASDDAHLWSDTFDGDSKDSIDIQESIAFRIASLLDTAMDPDELTRMVAAGTDSIAAWEAHLQMSSLFVAALDDIDRSRGEEILALYEQIVAWDPAFGEAHALMARIYFAWLDGVDTRDPPDSLPKESLLARFGAVSQLAAEHARTEGGRLDVELLRDKMRVNVAGQIDVSHALLRLRPHDVSVWGEYVSALIVASRFDDARAAIAGMPMEAVDGDAALLLASSAVRVDVAEGLAMARRALARPSPSAGALYQAHRIFLYAGLLDDAADTAQRFSALQADPTLLFLLRLRQACAEGRVADADVLFESSSDVLDSDVTEWLTLKILGKDDDAREFLRPLDTPATLFALARLLTYTHFDPRPYPHLSKRLQAQGAQREIVATIPYACKR